MTTTKRLQLLMLGLVVCGNSSCTQRQRPPRIDADAAGKAAIAEFDANGDAVIGGTELDRIPAIRVTLDKFDTNGDKQVSAEEITARIEKWQRATIAAMPVNCSVRVGGRPLAGATIVLEPESFLGDQLRPATGITDQSGFAFLSMATADGSTPASGGVQCGLYKVRITKLNGSKQMIPAKYNSDTQLGLEVARDALFVRDGLRFDL
jgi:hypothetical protein